MAKSAYLHIEPVTPHTQPSLKRRFRRAFKSLNDEISSNSKHKMGLNLTFDTNKNIRQRDNSYSRDTADIPSKYHTYAPDIPILEQKLFSPTSGLDAVNSLFCTSPRETSSPNKYTRVKSPCVALQTPEPAHHNNEHSPSSPAIIITTLISLPFSRHEELLTMDRSQIIGVAEAMNERLPRALRITVEDGEMSIRDIREAIEVLVGIKSSVECRRDQAPSFKIETAPTHAARSSITRERTYSLQSTPPTSLLRRRTRPLPFFSPTSLDRLSEEEVEEDLEYSSQDSESELLPLVKHHRLSCNSKSIRHASTAQTLAPSSPLSDKARRLLERSDSERTLQSVSPLPKTTALPVECSPDIISTFPSVTHNTCLDGFLKRSRSNSSRDIFTNIPTKVKKAKVVANFASKAIFSPRKLRSHTTGNRSSGSRGPQQQVPSITTSMASRGEDSDAASAYVGQYLDVIENVSLAVKRKRGLTKSTRRTGVTTRARRKGTSTK